MSPTLRLLQPRALAVVVEVVVAALPRAPEVLVRLQAAAEGAAGLTPEAAAGFTRATAARFTPAAGAAAGYSTPEVGTVDPGAGESVGVARKASAGLQSGGRLLAAPHLRWRKPTLTITSTTTTIFSARSNLIGATRLYRWRRAFPSTSRISTVENTAAPPTRPPLTKSGDP